MLSAKGYISVVILKIFLILGFGPQRVPPQISIPHVRIYSQCKKSFSGESGRVYIQVSYRAKEKEHSYNRPLYIGRHSWDKTISSTSMLKRMETYLSSYCKLAHQVTNQRQHLSQDTFRQFWFSVEFQLQRIKNQQLLLLLNLVLTSQTLSSSNNLTPQNAKDKLGLILIGRLTQNQHHMFGFQYFDRS